MLKAEIIRPKYESRGWVEQEHRWNTCNCIDIARELLHYEDIELLVTDMELIERVKNKSLDGHMESMEVHNFNVALAASRLAAASIITSIEELYIDHMNEDFSSVRNLSHLVRIVKNGVYLTYLTIKEFSAYFSHICCKELDFLFHEEIHTDKDIDSLTKVLNDRVRTQN